MDRASVDSPVAGGRFPQPQQRFPKPQIPNERSQTKDPKRIEIADADYDIADYNKYTKQHLTMDDDTQTNVASSEELDAPIGIIDYGINNVKSVLKAFRQIGKQSCIVTKPKDLTSIQVMVLPGVGSFGEGMQTLKNLGLVEEIRKEALKGKKD